ncbi:MAG: STAS domain-containing protein [Verrucomicrobiae bacterium]|nr:STAS domain-containing protein [Verrucomicrobiae bacterium]
MSIQFHPGSHHLTITIDTSVFEAADAAQLESDLAPFSNEAVESVELDLAQVEQIDSEAICTLVSLHHRFAHPFIPAFALRNPRPEVRRVFDLLGIDRIFAIENTPVLKSLAPC